LAPKARAADQDINRPELVLKPRLQREDIIYFVQDRDASIESVSSPLRHKIAKTTAHHYARIHPEDAFRGPKMRSA